MDVEKKQGDPNPSETELKIRGVASPWCNISISGKVQRVLKARCTPHAIVSEPCPSKVRSKGLSLSFLQSCCFPP
jgi:hypothetical protein